MIPGPVVLYRPPNYVDWQPLQYALGPDGNLWVAEYTGPFLKVSLDGTMTEYALPYGINEVMDITRGPDGNLWFVQRDTSFPNTGIGYITTGGLIKSFGAPSGSYLVAITRGADGNLWVGDDSGNVDKVTTSGQFTSYPLPHSQEYIYGIATGADGNIWMTVGDGGANVGKVDRVTTSGQITEFVVDQNSAGVGGIAEGYDGNVWFTDAGATSIGSITPKGVITEYKVPGSLEPTTIATGPDEIWFGVGSSGCCSLGHFSQTNGFGIWHFGRSRVIVNIAGIIFVPNSGVWMTIPGSGYLAKAPTH